jgi:response regulator RpfG family c-di-GMP phosphodiesterase
LWSAQFLSGLISFEQFVENVENKQKEFDPEDYSSDALYINVQAFSNLTFLASKMNRLKGIKEAFVDYASAKSLKYISNIPMNANSREINSQFQTATGNLLIAFKPAEQLNSILKLTTFRHIPTYAHSIMVGKIAVCLTKHLIQKDPACFIGCLGFERVEDVKNGESQLIELAEKSGLCHDIGKISYAGNPFMNAKNLSEDELRIVKAHPRYGYTLLTRDIDSAQLEGYMDVILGHHKHYDNQGGYPEDFDINSSKHRMFIDIIYAADTIDEHTDNISKGHIDGDSLERVRAAVISGAGREYSPIVAKLLEDAQVMKDIERILETERKEAYFTAYTHAWS